MGAISICATVWAVVIQAPVEPRVHGAADVGQTKGRQSPVERRNEGAEQHRRQAEPGNWLGRRRKRGVGDHVAHRRPSRASTLATTDMPGRSLSSQAIGVVDQDLDRDPLHHLGEVSRGVVRRSRVNWAPEPGAKA